MTEPCRTFILVIWSVCLAYVILVWVISRFSEKWAASAHARVMVAFIAAIGCSFLVTFLVR